VIELPRVLARDFRAVLRRLTADTAPRGPLPPVLCRAGPGGRTLYAAVGDVAVCHHRDGDFPLAEMAFPGAALALLEGGPSQPVTLEEFRTGRGRARWEDGGSVRSAEFPVLAGNPVPPFPDRPASMTVLPDSFGTALGEAALTTADQDSARLALSRLQLRGREGAVVASDGRQLFYQSGFPLPWDGDLIVPRVPAFAGRLLAGVAPVAVGKTESHVLVAAGPWTFALPIDAAARYPDVKVVIPRPGGRGTRLRLAPEDAGLLLKALPGLPGHDEAYRPVTLDLGPNPAVRARAESGETVQEIELARSSVTGPELQLVTDRRYLVRALRLGFTEIEAGPGERPLVCRDGPRIYLWMYLHYKKPVAPAAVKQHDSTPPASSSGQVPSQTQRKSIMPPSPPPNSSAPRNGASLGPNSSKPPEATIDDLQAEGEALRTLLQEAQVRLGRLLTGLKHHRRQAKAVETALASLRPFQRVGEGAP
jgi:hypothetical protein